MAGVKGMKGGGGSRPGAGRPRKQAVNPENPLEIIGDEPKAFLESVMKNSIIHPDLRIRAATALLPYLYAKKGDAGKKETRAEAAKKVSGKFAPAAPPRLVVDNSRK